MTGIVEELPHLKWLVLNILFLPSVYLTHLGSAQTADQPVSFRTHLKRDGGATEILDILQGVLGSVQRGTTASN